MAKHGASVVVNDLGGNVDGSGTDAGPAQEVVDEITGDGGKAVANNGSVAERKDAEEMMKLALDALEK